MTPNSISASACRRSSIGWPRGWSYPEVLPAFRAIESDPAGDPRWHGATGPVPVSRVPLPELSDVGGAFLDAAVAAGFRYRGDLNAPGADGVGAVPLNRVGAARVSPAMAFLAPALRRPNLRVRTGAVVRRLLLRGGRAVGALVGSREVPADRVVEMGVQVEV